MPRRVNHVRFGSSAVGDSGTILPCVGRRAEASCMPVGFSLGASRGPARGSLEASGGLFWGLLGPLLGLLGASWGPLGASWGPLGASWVPFGAES